MRRAEQIPRRGALRVALGLSGKAAQRGVALAGGKAPLEVEKA